jgi:hypothetical protein
MENVEAIVEKGRRTNFARCNEELKPVERPILKKSKISCNEKDARVFKIQFPRKPKYPKCQHQNDFTLNRSLLTANDYLKILSRPRKVSSAYTN